VNDQGRSGRLPTDEAYWTSLAARIINEAFERGSRTTFATDSGLNRSPWWTPMAEAAMRLTAAALVALITAALLLRPGPPRGRDGNTMRAVLAPDDPMLQSLVVESTEPPAASALIGLLILREGDR
jgi:hypothetical protein